MGGYDGLAASRINDAGAGRMRPHKMVLPKFLNFE
jgi:hypothetical protein